MRLLALLACGLVILAGCLGGSQDRDDRRDRDDGPSPAFDHDNATWPTGQAARDYVESYVMEHPFRAQNAAFQPFMDQARDSLDDLLVGFGHDVVRHDYGDGINILAVQNGTVHPEQWVVLSAHYDTIDAGVGTTVYGAWDDGAGVGALLALAEALADHEFPYTLVYAFFDGEEQGLVGSKQFVQTYFEDGEHDLVANINMDPPGLNWPCGDVGGPFPVKIIHEMDRVEEGHPRFAWLHHAIEHGLAAAEVPDEVRDYTPGIPIATAGGQGVTGGSDHISFGDVGVANVFLGGTPTSRAPGDAAAALTYPLHTPLDTLEAMEARCTEGSLAEGLHTTVTTVTTALVWMAQEGVPQRG